MSDLNFKDFLTNGCFLQLSHNLFKLMWGPFVKSSIPQRQALSANTLLLRPKFWSFLESSDPFSTDSVYMPLKSVEMNREEFIGHLLMLDPKEFQVVWEKPSEAAFIEQFKWGQDKISSRVIQKFVPIIRQTGSGEFNFHHRVSAVLNLLRSEGFGWSYGSFSSDETILGKTPEILVSTSGFNSTGKLNTQSMALAGTFPNTADGLALIQSDQKTRDEHNWVVADMDEKTIGLDKQILSTEVMELKHLLHLKTDFIFNLNSEIESVELAEKLHPTAAMGIFPNNRDVLKELSKFEIQKSRDFFAAPYGIIEKGRVHIVVGIRCLRVLGQQFIIDSGCGVTSESRLESELTELENKRNSVKKMLGIFHD